MMDEQPRGCRRTLLSMVVIVGAIVLCIGGITLGLDGMCVASIGPRAPLYPGATVTSERHTLLRTFGMGETVMILYSPDDSKTVNDWYARTVGGVLRDNMQRSIRVYGSANYSVTTAEDGTGSQIILYSTCGG
ncbi:MAG: hypothetical protein K8I30_06075 [Anaerolineae bacterium]|nr:hypothetical protein [Anaerolineae bacterium]